jgi:hypothetical protein
LSLFVALVVSFVIFFNFNDAAWHAFVYKRFSITQSGLTVWIMIERVLANKVFLLPGYKLLLIVLVNCLLFLYLYILKHLGHELIIFLEIFIFVYSYWRFVIKLFVINLVFIL